MMRLAQRVTAPLLAAAFVACGAPAAPHNFGWVDTPRPRAVAGEGALRIRWSKRLTATFNQPFIPVEHAGAGLDPVRDRVFIGSAQGGFFAFSSNGRSLFRYDARSGIEAAPVVDTRWGDVFLASEDGVVHALRGRTGEPRWKESSGGPVRQPPVLAEDAVYVVTEDDKIVALSREDGEILWVYDREVDTEYAIAGHAGLLLHEGRLYCGFTDGAVVAVDAGDGSLVWERPTSLDYEPDESEAVRFFDVDTTPVLLGDTLYVASFTTGIYALDPGNGSVKWREARTGVTGLAGAGSFLVVASADEGVYVLQTEDRQEVWRREAEEGAPGPPLIAGSVVLVGESKGSLMALQLRSGLEVARLDAGSGFSAPVAVAGRYGFVLSNGGTLMAFSL
ncbi:MAG: PQQ-binding-like beta-propeller repeat protein [Myxococcota bacterium]